MPVALPAAVFLIGSSWMLDASFLICDCQQRTASQENPAFFTTILEFRYSMSWQAHFRALVCSDP
jgi:hypothetical protein